MKDEDSGEEKEEIDASKDHQSDKFVWVRTTSNCKKIVYSLSDNSTLAEYLSKEEFFFV